MSILSCIVLYPSIFALWHLTIAPGTILSRMPIATPIVVLDGKSLDITLLTRVARDPGIKVGIASAAMEKVRIGRRQIEQIVTEYHASLADGAKPNLHVYGVTTGFGEFKNEPVPPEDLVKLQQNILISHAAGTGDNANADDLCNYFSADVIRAVLVLRLNTLIKGHSGVREELVNCIAEMINSGIVPLVPTRGSVGSSGDLCPLAHLFVVLLGRGRFYRVQSPTDCVAGASPTRLIHPAAELANTITTVAPSYKEGLGLTNGATFSAAMLALSVFDAEQLANTADVATAMTVEAVCGRTRAFDEAIHDARNMQGQRASASNIRANLKGSRLADRARSLQDAYSIRCSPQVHGATRDTIAYAKMVALAEMNAATDNPLFFPELGRRPFDVQSRIDRGDDEADLGDERAFSAGNFHGQPVALAADFLAIALAELCNIAERRTQLLLDRHHNRNLPPNLISRRGVNSGLMLIQYTAAGIVSENKVLTHPSSVDSIPTSGNSEDHNAMATYAARKLRTVVGNAQAVLSINLLAAAQAIDWRVGMEISPNSDTTTQNVIGAVADKLAAAEQEAKQFEAAVGGQSSNELFSQQLGAGTCAAYRAIRAVVPTLLADRVIADDLRAVREIVGNGTLANAVAKATTPIAINPLRAD
ncbi:MAG TPA: aromatic amino acid lyase [Tepidisphaeraceae bacterium]|nr:aromatic amino acid lyase [Tepidisphaeraceae bacterium]